MASKASKTRIERDSMGEMEVPADALWGASTQRAVLNFPVSGERFPRHFIQALGLIKGAAAAATLATLGQAMPFQPQFRSGLNSGRHLDFQVFPFHQTYAKIISTNY